MREVRLFSFACVTLVVLNGFEFASGQLEDRGRIVLDVAGDPQVVGVNPYTKQAAPAAALNITQCLEKRSPGIDLDTLDDSGGVKIKSWDVATHQHIPCSDMSTTVLSPNQRIKVQVKFDQPVPFLPRNALIVDNGRVAADVIRDTVATCEAPPCPYIEGSLTVFDVLIDLGAPDTVTSIHIDEDALQEEVGMDNVASNVLLAVYDRKGPKPKITALPQGTFKGRPAAAALIDFGERVLGDPRALFNVSYNNTHATEPSKLHIVYDVMYGRVYLIWDLEAGSPILANIHVPAGITTDLVGHLNQEADFQLVYYPEDSSASSFGAAAGVLWGLGSAVSAVGAVAGVVPATTLLRGVHYAQSFYWLGQLAIQNMPVNYQSASRQLRFITLDYNFYSSSNIGPSAALDDLFLGRSEFDFNLSTVVLETTGKAYILGAQQTAQILSTIPIPGGLFGLDGSQSAVGNITATADPTGPPLLGSFCNDATQCPRKAVCTPQFASDGLARCRAKAWLRAAAKARLENGSGIPNVLPYSPEPSPFPSVAQPSPSEAQQLLPVVAPEEDDQQPQSQQNEEIKDEGDKTPGSLNDEGKDTDENDDTDTSTPSPNRPSTPQAESTPSSKSPSPSPANGADPPTAPNTPSPSSPTSGTSNGPSPSGSPKPPSKSGGSPSPGSNGTSSDKSPSPGASPSPAESKGDTPSPSTKPEDACQAPDQPIFISGSFVKCTQCAPALPYIFPSEGKVGCYPGCPDRNPLPWFDSDANFKGCFSGCDKGLDPFFEAGIFLGCHGCDAGAEPVFLKGGQYYCTKLRRKALAIEIEEESLKEGVEERVRNRHIMDLVHGAKYTPDLHGITDFSSSFGHQHLGGDRRTGNRRSLRASPYAAAQGTSVPLGRKLLSNKHLASEMQVVTAGRLLVVVTALPAALGEKPALGNSNITGGPQQQEEEEIANDTVNTVLLNPSSSGTTNMNITNMLDGSISEVAPKIESILSALDQTFMHNAKDDLQPFWNAVFWSLIIGITVFVLQIGARAWILHRGNGKIPLFLLYPFLQLATAFVVLPIIIAAAAVYLRSTTGSLAIGILIAVLLPLACIAGAAYLVLCSVGLPHAGERAAEYVVGDVKNSNLAVEEHRQSYGIYYSTLSAWSSKDSTFLHEFEQQELPELSWWVRYILAPVFGYKRGEAGHWQDSRYFNQSFVGTWGPLFGDNKGMRVLHVGGTYRMNYRTGTLDRGKMVPLVMTKSQKMVSFAQLLGTVILLVKVVWFADFFASFSDPSSDPIAPLTTLLLFSVAYWIYLRACTPPTTSTSLIIDLTCATFEIITLICALVVTTLAPEEEQTLHNLGIAMLVGQFFNLLAGYVVALVTVFRRCVVPWIKKGFRIGRKTACIATPADQFAGAVQKVMMKDPYLLARKFADRWLVKALKRGLHKRKLLAHERGTTVLPRICIPRGWTRWWPGKPEKEGYQRQGASISPIKTRARSGNGGSIYSQRSFTSQASSSPRTPMALICN